MTDQLATAKLRELYQLSSSSEAGLILALCDALDGDETREIVQAEYDHYRGHYPHVICRLELRWQRGDIRQRDRYMALGYDVDPEDCPEVYA